jgi:hypothetical protein
VRVQVEDLRHQPDPRSIEEAAQEEDLVGQHAGVLLVAKGEGSGVGQGDGAQDHGELGLAGELVPVVADQEHGGESNQSRGRCHENGDRARPAPLGHLAGTFIEVGDALGLLVGDDGVPPPDAQLVQQPGPLLCVDGSLRHARARPDRGW